MVLQPPETEDELAAVLAHEIAHSEKRHLARNYDWELPLHLVGAVVPLVTLGLVPNPVTLALSRSKQAQADEVGLRLMAKAGWLLSSGDEAPDGEIRPDLQSGNPI